MTDEESKYNVENEENNDLAENEMKNEFDLEDKSEYLDVDYTPHEDEDNINSLAGKEFYR